VQLKIKCCHFRPRWSTQIQIGIEVPQRAGPKEPQNRESHAIDEHKILASEN